MPSRAPFLLAAFASSALLFAVEPLAARLVLPTFGGAPAVWNGTLLFFQAALLLGYGLAHLSATRFPSRVQRIVQPVFLLASLLTVPLARESGLQGWVRDRAAQGGAGVGLLLVALAGLVGLPFVALSVNGPLLQRWYASTDAPDASRPTFLYAAGNVGSIAALLAYPLFVEPGFGLREQAALWRWGLFGLALLVGGCALLARPGRATGTEGSPADVPDTPAPRPGEAIVGRGVLAQRLRWLAFAAVPSALLMGCTTYLTSNVAPIPLLWVVPLALYLLTFILVFAARPVAPVAILGRVFPMLAVPLAVTMLLQATTPIGLLAAFHLGVFFVAAWMCHGRLAREAPAADRLTEYWLFVSLGGALGGAFVAVVAPPRLLLPRRVPDRARGRRPSPTGDPPDATRATRRSRRAVGRPTPSTRSTRRASPSWPSALVLVVKPRLPAGTERTFLLMGVPAALAFAAIDRPPAVRPRPWAPRSGSRPPSARRARDACCSRIAPSSASTA